MRVQMRRDDFRLLYTPQYARYIISTDVGDIAVWRGAITAVRADLPYPRLCACRRTFAYILHYNVVGKYRDDDTLVWSHRSAKRSPQSPHYTELNMGKTVAFWRHTHFR